MQHLSRRFSGYVFLYVVITSLIWLVVSNLAVTFGIGYYFFENHATLIILLFRFAIFAPPLVVALRRYSARDTLRIHPFTLRQLAFTFGIAVCVYFALTTIGILLDKLNTAILYPDFADFSNHYFSVRALPFWPQLFTNCMIPSILAGTVYYGIILSGFHQMPPLKACLTVGLLYALVQFEMTAFIPNALLGFVLCYITLRANSVIPGVIAAFLYLLLKDFALAGRLYFSVLSPLNIGENAAAIIMAIVFILFGGLLLVKMSSKRYEKGSAKSALYKLRAVFPGLFSLSGLDGASEDSEMPEDAASTKTDVTDVVESKPDRLAEVSPTVLPLIDAASTDPDETVEISISPRENNPMIVGLFISAAVTIILYGFMVFVTLGFFGG